MGSSHARENAPFNVVVECASILRETLLCVNDLRSVRSMQKRNLLGERVRRQQSMIRRRARHDIWYCLYFCLLEVAECALASKRVTEQQIGDMFGAFRDQDGEAADVSDDGKMRCTEYDLATQMLMIAHQLLRFSSNVERMDVATRWTVHDSIAASVDSAQKRSQMLWKQIDRRHRPALIHLFKLLSAPYERARASDRAIPAPSPPPPPPPSDAPPPPPPLSPSPRPPAAELEASTNSEHGTRASGYGHTRHRTVSRRGILSSPEDWSK